MDLLSLTYPQDNLEEILAILDDGENKNFMVLPWIDGNMVTDNIGNVQNYITENSLGGIDVLDKNTNFIGSSISIDDGVVQVTGSNGLLEGTLITNHHGGVTSISHESNNNFISFENIFGGKTIYSNDMELLGLSKEQLSAIDYSTKEKIINNLDIDFPQFDSIMTYAFDSETINIEEWLDSLSFIDFL